MPASGPGRVAGARGAGAWRRYSPARAERHEERERLRGQEVLADPVAEHEEPHRRADQAPVAREAAQQYASAATFATLKKTWAHGA